MVDGGPLEHGGPVMIAGSVKAILGADTRPLNMAINKAKVTVKGLGKTLRSALGQFGIGIGMASFITSLTRLTSELERTSKNLGISTDFLQAMQYAAQQNELSTDGMSMALQRFTRRSAEAANGTGELAKVFKENNIQVRHSNGRLKSSEELLKDFAEAVKNAESVQEQLRLAFKAFDSEGANYVALLKDGAEGLDELKRKAQEAGVIIDQKTIKSVNIFTTQIKNMGTQLAATLANKITPFLEAIEELGALFGGWVGGGFIAGFDEAQKVADAQKERAKIFEAEVDAQKAINDGLADQVKMEERINELRSDRADLSKELIDAREDRAFRFGLDELQGARIGRGGRQLVSQIRNEQERIQRLRNQAARAGGGMGVDTREAAWARTMADALQQRLDQFMQANSGRIDLLRSVIGARQIAQLENAMREAARLGQQDRALALQSRANQIRGSLEALNSNERSPFAGIETKLDNIQSEMEALNRQMAGTQRVRVENAQ